MRHAAALTLAIAAAIGCPHAAAQDATADALASIHRRYVAMGARLDVGVLVALDGELRRLLTGSFDQSVSAAYRRPEHEQLGLEPQLFEAGTLTYNGKLLRDAHRLDPRSPYRRYTLFATIFPRGNNANDVPSPAAADAYLREFPAGPFATEAKTLLAFFYDDLHKVIRRVIAGETADYKYDCYKPYLTGRPREQLDAARRNAIRYYREAVATKRGDENITAFLRDIERGENDAWFFCGD